MKIPNKIRLLEDEYSIIFKDLDAFKEKNDYLGWISIPNKQILLDVSLKHRQDKCVLVLLHELSHYFQAYYGLEGGEMFAEAFSHYIFQIFKQLEEKVKGGSHYKRRKIKKPIQTNKK